MDRHLQQARGPREHEPLHLNPRQLRLRQRQVGALLACAWALFACLIAGCSSESSTDGGSTADAYAVVIGWFVDRSSSEGERPLVFVEALGEGVGIGLDTQAAVVSSTEEFAEVRFIDDRSEAFDGEVVRDGGIFLALGPAVGSDRSSTIEAVEIESESETASWTFDLVTRAGVWGLRGDPVRSD